MEYVGLFYGHLVYFTAIWYMFVSFGIFYDYLVYFMIIWYIFSRFGMSYEEKSGNPGANVKILGNDKNRRFCFFLTTSVLFRFNCLTHRLTTSFLHMCDA
jgi:hypothetical protein